MQGSKYAADRRKGYRGFYRGRGRGRRNYRKPDHVVIAFYLEYLDVDVLKFLQQLMIFSRKVENWVRVMWENMMKKSTEDHQGDAAFSEVVIDGVVVATIQKVMLMSSSQMRVGVMAKKRCQELVSSFFNLFSNLL